MSRKMFERDVKIDNKMKTKITDDWLKEYSSYKKTRPCLLQKRIGPLINSFGYEVRYGTDIMMSVSIFNLSNPLDFICANLKTRPESRRKRLTWIQHEQGKYKEAAEELRQQAAIPLEGPITLSQVINAYKNYSRTESITSKRHLEDPALIAAWAGKTNLAKELLDWAKPYYEKRFNTPSYQSTEEWYKEMLGKISDPEKLRQIVEEQVTFHKLTKIPYEELIIDIE